MTNTPRSVVFLISILFLTSLSCSLVSQISSPAASSADETTESNSVPSTESTLLPETAPPPDQLLGDGLVPPPSADGGACANTFYPMIPGYQWIYEVTAEGETNQISLTVTEVNGNQATLHALYLKSGVTSETIVDCDDGAILSFPVVMLGFLFGDVDGDLTMVHQSGVFAPNYQTLSDQNWDAEWAGEYLASGTLAAQIEGQPATGTLEESPLHMQWNTLGAGQAIFETVSVKAGNYPQAIKLERQIDFDFTAEVTENGTPMSLKAAITLQNNLWFEPNIGLLKQEIDQASVKLYGVNFPIEMTGTMELVEFRISE